MQPQPPQPPGGGYPPQPPGGGGYPPPGGGGYPPPGGYPPGAPMGQPVAGNAPSATKALIFGLIGTFCTCWPLGIAGIIFGGKAKKEIADSGGYLQGGGMATAGIVLGWISIALAVLSIILYLTGALTFNFSTDY